MVKCRGLTINVKLAAVVLTSVALVSLSCAPRASLRKISTANPIEIIDRSPRVYHIGFESIADSIATVRLARYLERGFLNEYSTTAIRNYAAIGDSARLDAIGEFLEALKEIRGGSRKEAGRHLKRAVELDPTFKPSYLLLARMLLRQGRLKEAFRIYMDIVTVDPTDSQALLGLGKCMMMLGDIENARKALVDAVIFDRSNLEAWQNLALVVGAEDKCIRVRDVPELALVRKRYGRHFDIIVDKSLEDCPAVATAWVVYASERAVWRYESKFKSYTGLTKYRPTYEEDIDCFMALAAAWNVLSVQDSILCETDYLDYLSKIAEEGYLVPHILFDYVCVDNPTAARDFSREVIQQIRKYINRFVIVPKG